MRWELTKYGSYIVMDSTDLGTTGADSFQTAVNMSEAGIRLCRMLLDAPDFLFADIGLNVDLDLEIDFINEGIPHGRVIVSEEFYNQLKERPHLDEFRKGYYWQPFTGFDLPVILAPQCEPIRRLYDDFHPNLSLQGWFGQRSRWGRVEW